MSDIGDLIDRINREFIIPPGEQPSRFIIQHYSGTAITSVTGSSSDDVIAKAAHGLSNGDKIIFTAITGGTGLATYTTYYVIGATTNTFQVSLTLGGSAITFADFTGGTIQELSDVTSTARTIIINTTLLTTEEEDLLAAGTLIEFDSEVLLIDAITGTTPSFTLTVRRAMLGTTAASHTDGTEGFIVGDDYVPRKHIFDTLADAIEATSPDLWTVGVEETWADASPVELPASALEILDWRVAVGGKWRRQGTVELLPYFPLSSTGQAFQSDGISANSGLQVYYKTKPSRPTAESDELADLFVDESWAKVIVTMAVAQLVANRDLSASTMDFITQSLEAEGVPVGSGSEIRNALLQFADFQLRPLKRAQAVAQHDRVIIESGF